MWRRIKRAWAVLTGSQSDGIETRALSFACAVLQHLEAHQRWDGSLCRVIAHEAELRGFAEATEAGLFICSPNALILAAQTPKPDSRLVRSRLQNL